MTHATAEERLSQDTSGIIGRLDDVIHYRGAKIWPRVIQETIMKFPEVLEYQVEVDRFGPSGFTIKVEMDNKKDNSEIKKEILAEMRKNLSFINPKVIFLPEGSLPRYEGKSKRIIFVS